MDTSKLQSPLHANESVEDRIRNMVQNAQDGGDDHWGHAHSGVTDQFNSRSLPLDEQGRRQMRVRVLRAAGHELEQGTNQNNLKRSLNMTLRRTGETINLHKHAMVIRSRKSVQDRDSSGAFKIAPANGEIHSSRRVCFVVVVRSFRQKIPHKYGSVFQHPEHFSREQFRI
jgi:hypothetical protein